VWFHRQFIVDDGVEPGELSLVGIQLRPIGTYPLVNLADTSHKAISSRLLIRRSTTCIPVHLQVICICMDANSVYT